MADSQTPHAVIAGMENPGRQIIRSALSEMNFEPIDQVSDMSELQAYFTLGATDLIVMNFTFADGAGLKLIKDLRHDRLGDNLNPYVPIIVTSWDSESEPLLQALSSGIDDFLIFPMPMDLLQKRLSALGTARKPFIVTSDYIGPERRRDPNRESKIPYFSPPNTLADKISGNVASLVAIRTAVDASRRILGAEKARREAFQIAFLARLITEDYQRNGDIKAVLPRLNNVASLAAQLEQRVKVTGGPSIDEITGSLTSTIATTEANPTSAKVTRVIRLLEPVSQALVLMLRSDLDETKLAGEVSDSVATYRSRRRDAGR